MTTNKEVKEKRKAERDRQKKIMMGLIIGGILLVVGVLIIGGYSAYKANAPLPTLGASDTTSTIAPTVEQVTPEPTKEIKQYSEYPPMTIDPAKKYFATFTMENGGKFVVQLYPDKAPLAVNNFVFLANEKFYDGTTFHRVLEGFMAQGGDPTGTGMGGPGYEFANENSDLTFDKEGVVAMANAGPDTNGSQFFITFGPADWLNGGYSIFGQVTEGMDVVKAITLRDPEQSPTYPGDMIKTIVITEQ